MSDGQTNEKIVLGGGCFWCTEAVFSTLKGVASVTPGYAGGHTEKPSYNDVSTGVTGHAEVIEVMFDSKVISLEDLLSVFFYTHDPTTLNKQGNDVGTQYRSVIFYNNDSQHKRVERFIKELASDEVFQEEPIVTEVAELTAFYEAEVDHKDYFKKNFSLPYCQIVIAPKIEKLHGRFNELVNTDSK